MGLFPYWLPDGATVQLEASTPVVPLTLADGRVIEAVRIVGTDPPLTLLLADGRTVTALTAPQPDSERE